MKVKELESILTKTLKQCIDKEESNRLYAKRMAIYANPKLNPQAKKKALAKLI